eukprot:9728-Chlamydomonas_euryale.AAC.1
MQAWHRVLPHVHTNPASACSSQTIRTAWGRSAAVLCANLHRQSVLDNCSACSASVIPSHNRAAKCNWCAPWWVALNGERYLPFTVHPVTGDRSDVADLPRPH